MTDQQTSLKPLHPSLYQLAPDGTSLDFFFAKCTFCGAPAADTKHVCKDKLAAMKFVCDGCGRVAMEKEHLCKPAPIGK